MDLEAVLGLARIMLPSALMALALDEARAAAAAGEVPVGAVVSDAGGRVLARAHNLTRTRRDPTAHAELLALRGAARALGSERLEGCQLTVTLEPCAMCAGALVHARVARLVYGAADPKGGAVEHGARVLAAPNVLHRPEVVGGIGEAQSAVLLQAFFRQRR